MRSLYLDLKGQYHKKNKRAEQNTAYQKKEDDFEKSPIGYNYILYIIYI